LFLGKSTIFKQIKILYGVPPDDEERLLLVPTIHQNVTTGMSSIIEYMESQGTLSEIENQSSLQLLISHISQEGEIISEEMGQAFHDVWTDEAVLLTWGERSKFHVVDSVKFYLDEIFRLSSPSYLPTIQVYLFYD